MACNRVYVCADTGWADGHVRGSECGEFKESTLVICVNIEAQVFILAEPICRLH